jgi:photosystem II stability/assembly factor-like uncharacterized protein
MTIGNLQTTCEDPEIILQQLQQLSYGQESCNVQGMVKEYRWLKFKSGFYLVILFFLLQLLLPGKSTVSSATPQAVLAYHVFLPLINNDSAPVAADWIGPGGGVIPDIAVDPNNPDIIYAAAWGGGIYKSIDAGQTWQRNNMGLENLNVNALEVAPKNSVILYAGTYRAGIYKSVDQGISWYRSDAGIADLAIPYAIEVDPTRSKRIYIATRSGSNNGTSPWGGTVYKSDDGAHTWKPLLTNVGGAAQKDWAYDLEIHARDPQVVYAAMHEFGPYRSQDYGQSWQAVNNGITNFSARALAVDPRTPFPGTVYLGVFTRAGIFKSKDGGNSWSLKDHQIADMRIFRAVLDPANSNKLYLATFDDGIMKSSDAGDSWKAIGLRDETIMDVAVRGTQPKIILGASLHNGLFRSTDGGATWDHTQSGLNASTVTSVVVLPGDSHTLFASLYPGWVRSTTDAGASWVDDNVNLDDRYIHALVQHPTQPHVIFALTDASGLYRRDTQISNKWQAITANLPSSQVLSAQPQEHPLHQLDFLENLYPEDSYLASSRYLQASSTPYLTMAFAPSNPSVAYLGTSGAGIHRSLDGGLTWSSAGLAGISVWSLAISPLDADLVFAATNQRGLVKMSDDGGVSWRDTLLPLGGKVYALSASLTDPDVVYAATSQGIYQHNGSNWLHLGFEGLTITAVAAHPVHPGVVYVGSGNGAYLSVDGGLTWGSGPDELTGIKVQAIHFDRNNPYVVYFATSAHGILRAPSP